MPQKFQKGDIIIRLWEPFPLRGIMKGQCIKVLRTAPNSKGDAHIFDSIGFAGYSSLYQLLKDTTDLELFLHGIDKVLPPP